MLVSQINADVDAFEREKDKFTAAGEILPNVFHAKKHFLEKTVSAEEEHEQEDALPWEFSNRALVDYEGEIKGIMLKLSVVCLVSF